jgi:hypothetical protein
MLVLLSESSTEFAVAIGEVIVVLLSDTRVLNLFKSVALFDHRMDGSLDCRLSGSASYLTNVGSITYITGRTRRINA